MEPAPVRNPVYHQLSGQLKAMLARDYRAGDKFLTERGVAERFAVSRPTANKALAGLVSEGVLEFRKGVGTFVRRGAIDYDVRSLVSFTDKARAAGKVPSTRLLAFRKVAAAAAPGAAREGLAVAAETALWELNRVRLADGVPVILEHRFVIERHCPRLTRAQAEGSLYRAWTDRHGLTVAGADEVIRAVPLAAAEGRALGVPARSPALEVTAVGFLQDGTPLWWERTLYRADQYEFHTRLGPIRSATPARGQLRPDALRHS